LTKPVIIYDKSVYGATRAGVYVFAKNILDQFRGEKESISLKEFNNPFSTIGKKGVNRKLFSILRIFYMELIVLRHSKRATYFFPAPEMPFLVILFRLRYVITIHDLFTWDGCHKTTFFARLRQKLLPLYARNAQKIFTVSEFSKKEISSKLNVNLDKIVVTHNGLSEEFINYKFSQEEFLNIKSKYPYENFLLYVGSMEPRKNIPFLIDVFESLNKTQLKEKSNPIPLILVGGEGWLRESIDSKINNSNFKSIIIQLGWVSDIEKLYLYRKALVTILPSIAEGFGIPVIESLSQKTPVLVNDNTALSDFKGFGATVIDDFEVSSWVNKILSPNKDYKLFVIDHYSWSDACQIILENIT
jgi:glycosyltransferase involved in cell wall biosynthesis